MNTAENVIILQHECQHIEKNSQLDSPNPQNFEIPVIFWTHHIIRIQSNVLHKSHKQHITSCGKMYVSTYIGEHYDSINPSAVICSLEFNYMPNLEHNSNIRRNTLNHFSPKYHFTANERIFLIAVGHTFGNMVQTLKNFT